MSRHIDKFYIINLIWLDEPKIDNNHLIAKKKNSTHSLPIHTGIFSTRKTKKNVHMPVLF